MAYPARADLHCHTTASDGDHSPAEVVRLATEAGLAAIAITDHDTTTGIKEALREGVRLGIEVVPGIEAKCEHKNHGMEILGYFIEADSAALRHHREDLLKRRRVRIERMLERLRGQGVTLRLEDVEAVAGGVPLGRPHLAAALVRAGYAATPQEAFDRYLLRSRPAYVPIEKPPAEQVIRCIHEAGGAAVLAHPGCMITPPDIEEFIGEVAELGLDGLEVWYPYGEAGRRVREEAKERQAFWARMERLADELGLLKTGGSDFHSLSRLAPLGAATCPYTTLQQLKMAAGF